MQRGVPRTGTPRCTDGCDGGSGLRDVLRRRALRALHDVELHRITLGQRLEAISLDRAVVHEAVFLTAVGSDEPEALRVVEPLYLAGRTHVPAPEKTDCLGSGTCRTPTIASAAGAPVSRRNEQMLDPLEEGPARANVARPKRTVNSWGGALDRRPEQTTAEQPSARSDHFTSWALVT